MDEFFSAIEMNLPLLLDESDWETTKQQIETIFNDSGENYFELGTEATIISKKKT